MRGANIPRFGPRRAIGRSGAGAGKGKKGMKRKDESSGANAREMRESLLQSLIDQSPAFIAVRAVDGIYLYANKAFAAALGVALEHVVGHRDEDLLPGIGIPPLLRAGRDEDDDGEIHTVLEEGELQGRPRRLLVTRFPIRAQGETFATGLIASPLDRPLGGGDDLQTSLAQAEAANAELRRALEHMERLAYTDRLTGAWNRRHLDDAVLVEMARTERHGHPVSMLLIDIDHFKSINDDYGHVVGDRVLVGLVRTLRAAVRRTDTVARWGGEEFLVLAPDTPRAEAEELARKLGARIADAPLAEGVAKPVTVSIGVAEYQSGEGFEAWLARADGALYRAKAAGRARSVADPATAFGPGAGHAVPRSLVKLVWRAAYNSGNDEIDRQHRGLFERTNRLFDAVLTGAPSGHVLGLARALVADIADHFAEEERLLASIGYPERRAHALEHLALLEKAAKLSEQAASGALVPAELFQFLAYEVISLHLLGADRHYFPYLEQPGGAAAGAG